MSGFLIGPTGRRVYFASPFAGLSPAQIVREVATGLSREQRFAGHLRKPYSVLQHSLVVARVTHGVGDSSIWWRELGALMHDGSEAYLRDIPKPVKELLPDYQALEQKFQSALFQGLVSDRFSFSHDDEVYITEADAACQVVEADMLGYGSSTYGIETGVSDSRYLSIERAIKGVLAIEDPVSVFVDFADTRVYNVLRNG